MLLSTQRYARGPELEAVYRGEKASMHEDLKTCIDGKETYGRLFVQRNPEWRGAFDRPYIREKRVYYRFFVKRKGQPNQPNQPNSI